MNSANRLLTRLLMAIAAAGCLVSCGDKPEQIPTVSESTCKDGTIERINSADLRKAFAAACENRYHSVTAPTKNPVNMLDLPFPSSKGASK